MKNIKFLFPILCFSYFQTGLGIEPDNNQNTYKEIYQLQNQINEDKIQTDYQELSISSWPNTRPIGTSKTITINDFSDTYDLYMWWEQGYLFAEAVPLNGSEAFICGAGWNIVQSISNTVTMFDTVKFENESSTSICQDFTSPIVFAIVQWEYIFDYYADFNAPFNLVSDRDPYDLVRVNGGVTLSTTTTSSIGTVSPDLSISIPSIEYQSLSGVEDIFLELKYNGANSNGILTWTLQDAGFN